MRIIVNSPPKCGNVWLRELLSEAYGLPKITVSDAAAGSGQALEAELIVNANSESFVTYCHIPPLEDYFSRAVKNLDAQVVSIIRNPYDIFVSLFHYIQKHSEHFKSSEHPLNPLVGKSIDSPQVLEYLIRDQYGLNDHISFLEDLSKASRLNEAAFGEWHYRAHGKSEGRYLGLADPPDTSTEDDYIAYVHAYSDLLNVFNARYVPLSWMLVRYEELLDRQAECLFELSQSIEPIGHAACEAAWLACTPEEMRKANPTHVREAKAGEGATLPASVLSVIRDHYSERIATLGYEVL